MTGLPSSSFSGKLDVLDDPFDLGSDAGLLFQLAERRLACALARLDAAAGKAPQPAKWRPRRWTKRTVSPLNTAMLAPNLTSDVLTL